MSKPCYKIKEIHERDHFYDIRERIVGQEVDSLYSSFRTIGIGEYLSNAYSAAGWCSGGVKLKNGNHYYFLAVKLERC